jgi:hypothetical protein
MTISAFYTSDRLVESRKKVIFSISKTDTIGLSVITMTLSISGVVMRIGKSSVSGKRTIIYIDLCAFEIRSILFVRK